MIILSYDPSLNNSGFVVYDTDKEKVLDRCLFSVDLKEQKDKTYTRPKKLAKQFVIMSDLIKKHKPEILISEKQFGGRMLGLDIVAETLAGFYNIEFVSFLPTVWKKYFCKTYGGAAKKSEVKQEVSEYFKQIDLEQYSEHETDCLGMIGSYIELSQGNIVPTKKKKAKKEVVEKKSKIKKIRVKKVKVT